MKLIVGRSAKPVNVNVREKEKPSQRYPSLHIQISVFLFFLSLLIKNVSNLVGVRNYSRFNMKSLLLSRSCSDLSASCGIVFNDEVLPL